MRPSFMKLAGGLADSAPAPRAEARGGGLKLVWRESQGSLRADWRFAAFQAAAPSPGRRPDRPGA